MRTKEELDTYIEAMRNALRSPAARYTFFPTSAIERKESNLRLGREFGAGLKDFNGSDVSKVLGGLYGIMIVANSLDSTGVQIDAKEFISQVNLTRHSEGSPPGGGL